MRIRKIREDDIGKIVSIIHKVMGPKDARKALQDIRETADKKNDAFKFDDFYVLEIGSEIVAAGGIWALKHDPLLARLDWFVVDPSHQRKGLGTMLIKFLEKQLRQRKVRIILAETSEKHEAAVNFWTKNRFKKAAKIPNYWEDGSSCLYFIKRLK